jgi:glycosyltransferase involved in cell wall biosynthesis
LNSALRVIILTPTALPNVTGNAITAERWRRSLSQKGIAANVVETQHLHARSLVDELDRFRPHIVHAHHVSRAGAFLLDPLVSEKYGDLPLVMSPAGTDINLRAMAEVEKDNVRRICLKARSVIIQNRETTKSLLEFLPNLQERIAYVPKSFLWMGDELYDLRAVAGCREEDILFFMPGGIRPVKGNLECLSAMAKVHDAMPNIRVAFAGLGLDAEYAARFEEEIRRLQSFATWIVQISPKAMRAAYEGADVVVNCSRSEGLSNALLEAMATGRPILASDIPGNRWLIHDERGIGPCGFLFSLDGGTDFVRKALHLANDGALRKFLAANGSLRAATWPNPSDEAQALLEIYHTAIIQKG